MSDLAIIPIDPDRLQAMRERGADEFANPWTRWTGEGWEPLRCCLRTATPAEDIALIAYSPWTEPSPWAESGPVFVHYDACDGPDPAAGWPANAGGAKVLRPYDRTGAIAYADIAVTGPDADNAAVVHELLADPAIDRVHVRALAAQCFAFEVRRA